MTPSLSIVTVTFNNAAGLAATVTSLRSLAIRPAELVVVDGGSDDGTRAYLEELELGFPLRWVSEPDGGIYDAMNKGVGMASGQLLHFLNAGDVVFGEPYAGLAGPALLPVRIESGRRTYLQRVPRVFRWSYCHQGVVFPAANVCFDASFRIAADLDLLLRRFPTGVASLPMQARGGVVYDLGGVSQRSKVARDREITRIYLRNGRWLLGTAFALAAASKRVLGPIPSKLHAALGYRETPRAE